MSAFFSTTKEVEATIDTFSKVMKNLKLNTMRDLNEEKILRIIRGKNQYRSFSTKSYEFVFEIIVEIIDSTA